MRIIGIDPGTAIVGYAILEENGGKTSLIDFGTIRTQKGLQNSLRLNQIRQDIETLIVKFKPQMASVEKLFFQKNIKTAMSVSEARGVIIEKLSEKGIDLSEYTPLEIKTAVCGNGKADKKMVQQMIKIIFGLREVPKPDDAADAIAAALCLSNSYKLQSKTR
ncbi:crossover junction endodeoxyribonuclease RuvC [Candidatus Peregrinibacteria bacterium]|nr:crossover junction endodeoxyribonuclease RuvC [Candidatus Peregrinibacteria bacterium]